MAKTAAIAASTNGAGNTLVAAIAGQKIRVLCFALSFSGTVNAKFQSGGSSDLTGLFYGVANVVTNSPSLWRAPAESVGIFETLAGEALSLNLSAGTAVGGFVVYEEVRE